MNRREMLASVVALPLVGVATASEPAESLQPFLRYDRIAGKWIPVSGFDVKAGDEICNPVDGLVVRVTRNDLDKRQFYSDYEIDPKTNTWVPCGSA